VVDVNLARQQWQIGERRVSANPNLGAQVDVVVAELRKRVGQTFTLAELANAYDGADEAFKSKHTHGPPCLKTRC